MIKSGNNLHILYQMQIEHYLQVVKTEVMTRSYKIVEEYEYTAHSSLAHSLNIPVAKFHFELSPMQVCAGNPFLTILFSVHSTIGSCSWCCLLCLSNLIFFVINGLVLFSSLSFCG